MVQYLSPNNEDVTIKIASFIALVQTHMIENVKSNFKEKYKPNLTCYSCKQSECNQKHLLECKSQLGSNELVTYIPNYEDIFDNDNLKEQVYIVILMIDNLQRKNKLENYI